MEIHNKKILVTGAGGFIGSHLVESLIEEGSTIRAFVRYNSRSDIGFLSGLSPEQKDAIDIYYGNLENQKTVEDAMENIQIVFHLAALVGIPYSYKHPEEVFMANSLGSLNVLSSARMHGVEKIVQASTSEVYGSALYVPIDEKHPLQPQSPYSATKIAAESLAMSFFYAYNTPVAIVRPFNTYGPRQSARAVIPTIITQALTQNYIKLGNLDTLRDFNYVKDTVSGFIQMAKSEKSIGKIINIGSGHSVSIGDLADTVLKIIGKNIDIRVDSQRIRPVKSEVTRLCADTKLAEKLLNWKPRYDLTAGLSQTIHFIKNNLNIYNPKEYVI
ncbi:GDP-mannose 4,6-dehydratase [Desulfococcaceae bacterium HSG7]|nr:GDP-mannose 4,6-dehydratase [Desulfococcaceae bacterium HSG7]